MVGFDSALSYARRYSLMSILGISPEDDDDAQGAARKLTKPPEQEPVQKSGGGAPPQGEPTPGTTERGELGGSGASQPPPDTPPVDVCKEWVDEFDVCTDIAKANALWKTVQKVWGTFAGEEQVRITMAKDRCKVRLTQRVEQGSLV